MRSFWDDNGAEILAKVPLVQSVDTATLMTLVDNVMRSIPHHIEAAAGPAATGERLTRDEDDYQTSFLIMSEQVSDPSSVMSSNSNSTSYMNHLGFGRLESSPYSLESTWGLAPGGGRDTLGLSDSPTRPRKIPGAMAGRPGFGGPQLPVMHDQSSGAVHGNLPLDDVLEPQCLLSSSFQDSEDISKLAPFDSEIPDINFDFPPSDAADDIFPRSP